MSEAQTRAQRENYGYFLLLGWKSQMMHLFKIEGLPPEKLTALTNSINDTIDAISEIQEKRKTER